MLELAKACLPISHAIAGIRTESLNNIMANITYLGDKSIFFIIGFILYWCVSKYAGYISLLSGTASLCICVALKDIFRIPRPFNLDPTLTIVEHPKNEVMGYSFPSGHATNIVATFGTVYLYTKNKLIKFVSILLILLICFSRIYLGAHTLLDVLVGLIITIIILAWYYKMIKEGEKNGINKAIIGSLLFLLVHIICVIIINVIIVSGNEIMDKVEHKTMIKMAVLLTALTLPIIIGVVLDIKYIKYDASGNVLFQVVKLILGLSIIITYKSNSKQIFSFVTGYLSDFLQYFVMMLLGIIVCPLIFKQLKKLKVFNNN